MTAIQVKFKALPNSKGLHVSVSGPRGASEALAALELWEVGPHLRREEARLLPKIRLLIVPYLAEPDRDGRAIPLESWANAISIAIARRLMLAEGGLTVAWGGDAALADAMSAAPPLLAPGGDLYELSPVRVLPAASRMLALLRAGGAHAARTAVAAIIGAAREEEARIAVRAKAMLAEATETRAQALRDRQYAVPASFADVPIITRRSGFNALAFYAHLVISFEPQWFECSGYRARSGGTRESVHARWPALSAPCVYRFWQLPFDVATGAYDVKQARIVRTGGESDTVLPHADYSATCVQPQGLPSRIQSAADLFSVAKLVSRAFCTVNLNSLLVSIDWWPPDVKAFAPDEALSVGRVAAREDGWSASAVQHAAITTSAEELAATWTERAPKVSHG